VDSYVQSIGMDARWVRHSRRTWQFASALADRDDAQLDPELIYVGSMLHDSGLFEPNPTRCFAVEGAAHATHTAKEANVDAERARTVAHAIASHISVNPDSKLGRYLQYGSLLDLTGTRLWKLDRDLVDRIFLADEREGLPKDVRERWPAECARFPHGRAAYAKCPGLFMLATRLAPLPN
jgi:hypothetical protein